ncbi:MAG TPA: ATP-binding cassette domain-containing protein [Chitinophagaceae bacterium]|nr:ATP-binding cassette domain-containing protein [Chitinophagaceae bacterium]
MIHKLEADGILLEFGVRKTLSDIYLKCETGKITGILGRNGQGKTCLMNIIYGSLEATSKSIRFDNVPVFNAFKRPDLLQYLPQFNFIPKSLTLKRIFSDFGLNYSEFEGYFPEYRSRYKSSIKNLSGGERRLIEVYAIIKSKSQFAMLDEPFTHLMPLQIEKVKEILKEEKLKKGFLVTDHLYTQIVDIGDDLYVLADGKAHLTKNINDIETLGYARL